MPRRKAKRAPDSGLHIVCPFCGAYCDALTALTWCSGCYVEYFQGSSGAFWFDTDRKTERFAIAKAVQKAGGMRIGLTDG